VQLAVGEPAAEAVDADPADEREAGDEEHDQRGAGEQELGAPRDDDADVVEGGEPDHDDRAPEDGGVEGEGAELDRAREVLAEQHGELVAGDADGHRRERAREGREELQPAGGEVHRAPLPPLQRRPSLVDAATPRATVRPSGRGRQMLVTWPAR
jgi:hypothetical protein